MKAEPLLGDVEEPLWTVFGEGESALRFPRGVSTQIKLNDSCQYNEQPVMWLCDQMAYLSIVFGYSI